MATNKQSVGILLRPKEEVTVDEDQWKNLDTYLKNSYGISIENYVLCNDNRTFIFLIPQSQGYFEVFIQLYHDNVSYW